MAWGWRDAAKRRMAVHHVTTSHWTGICDSESEGGGLEWRPYWQSRPSLLLCSNVSEFPLHANTTTSALYCLQASFKVCRTCALQP